MGIRHTVEVVTPEKAEKWLGVMGPNRNIRPNIVARLAESMRRDEWMLTGEAIKFDEEGKLLDGQHRLHAIVEAGVGVEMTVVRGLQSEAMTVLDTGAKRNLGDILRIRGEVNTALLGATLVATAQVRHAIDTGQWPHMGKNPAARYPTHTESLELLEKEPEIREAVQRERNWKQRQSGITVQPTVLSTSYYHLSTYVDEPDTEAFFSLLSGIEVQEHSPVWKFRRRFATNLTDRPDSRRDQFALLFKTWNYWRNGDQPNYLTWRPGGASPERFPEPR